MTGALLHIFFHGLIAFVADRPASGMTSAYALENTNHSTVLGFKMATSSGCDYQYFGTTYCTKLVIGGDPWCACDIKDASSISFDHAPLPVPNVKLPGRPFTARPLNRTSASNLSWLVKMSDVNEGNGHARSLEAVKDSVRADLSFTWQEGHTCHLDQVTGGDDCEAAGNCDRFKIYPNRFVTNVSSTSGYVQALAEGITFDVPFDQDFISLVIQQRVGTGKIMVKLCSGGTCPDLIFNNDIHETVSSDPDPSEDMGLHFLDFYKIAQDSSKKRFPMRLREGSSFLLVDTTQLTTCPNDPLISLVAALDATKIDESFAGATEKTKEEELLELLRDMVRTSFQTRIICPMAAFEN